MTRHYEDFPAWEKALRAIVVAGELGCPGEGLALVARKALADSGVPFDTAEPLAAEPGRPVAELDGDDGDSVPHG